MLLHEIFIRTARRHGRKPAFVDCTTNRRVTYRRALIGALLLSRRFDRYRPGFLGIMLPTSAGCGLSILGALLSGRTPVMINYSTGADANIRYAREKCGFETVVTSRALIEKVGCPEMPGMVFLEDIMKSAGAAEKLRAAALAALPPGLLGRRFCRGHENDNAVILFTSGSEKEPKAVQLTHRNIRSNIESFSRVYALGADDRMLACLPFFHIFGLTVNFWTPLYFGMTAVTYANPLDYRKVCEIARDEKPTMMVGTPAFFWGYLRKSRPGDFSSLRVLVTGADKCPESLRKGFEEKHGLTLYEGYGATETSPVISVNTPEANRPGSVGKVLPGVEVRIECFETGEPCPAGRTGRILVRGDLVMKGYLEDFEETAMRIRHGWYDTGDLGYLDEDGFLWHAGRLKRFVKIGGEMVSLVRVEDELVRLLPEETEVCVVEVPDPLKGARIAAAVTEPVDADELLSRLAGVLPNIALPRHFVVLEELPKMGSGKVDFRKTAALVLRELQGPGGQES